MRKFFVFLILLSCFIFCGVFKNDFASAVLNKSDSVVHMLTNTINLNCEYGETIVGDSCCFSLQQFQSELNCKLVKQEKVDNVKVYYMFTNSLPNYVLLQNKKINLQIAFDDNKVYIGYPMIIGSF